jgi:hypothetical protein
MEATMPLGPSICLSPELVEIADLLDAGEKPLLTEHVAELMLLLLEGAGGLLLTE